MFDAAVAHADRTPRAGENVATEKKMFATNVAQIVSGLTALDDHARAQFYKAATNLRAKVFAAETGLKGADHDLTMSNAVDTILAVIPKPKTP